MKKDKRGLEFEVLAKWIIGLVVLVIIVLGVLILRDKGSNLIEKLKDMFIFWR